LSEYTESREQTSNLLEYMSSPGRVYGHELNKYTYNPVKDNCNKETFVYLHYIYGKLFSGRYTILEQGRNS